MNKLYWFVCGCDSVCTTCLVKCNLTKLTTKSGKYGQRLALSSWVSGQRLVLTALIGGQRLVFVVSGVDTCCSRCQCFISVALPRRSEWGVCVGVCSPPASLPLFFSVTVVVFVALITVGVGSLALFPSTVFQCDCCCFCCPCYCRRWFPSTVFQWDCCCFWCPYYCRRWFPSTALFPSTFSVWLLLFLLPLLL